MVAVDEEGIGVTGSLLHEAAITRSVQGVKLQDAGEVVKQVITPEGGPGLARIIHGAPEA